ncbi:MAG: HD domain-containing protein [Crocinitomicaceae bacterium]|nr:HD domain-containing protein [Crocinitomicaceae bacterium]
MDSSLLIQKITSFVKSQYCDIASGHEWYHINRVKNNALHLQSIEGGNKTIIEIAALLHDISDYKFNGGDEYLGGDVSYNAVIDCGGSEELATLIKEIVNSISYKGANVADTTTSLEAKIVQDADRLDALGAIGIARTFAYGGSKGSPIYDPTIHYQLHDSFDKYKNAKSTSINHFYEKLLLLGDKMHTNSAKLIAKERTNFMKEFLSHFYEEWECKY